MLTKKSYAEPMSQERDGERGGEEGEAEDIIRYTSNLLDDNLTSQNCQPLNQKTASLDAMPGCIYNQAVN